MRRWRRRTYGIPAAAASPSFGLGASREALLGRRGYGHQGCQQSARVAKNIRLLSRISCIW
eukprot:358553-Chlamydomonas_euryale.AAC.6